MGDEMALAYDEYLKRFEAALGDLDVGVFVKHQGRLIQKMAYDEFRDTYAEYCEMAAQYRQSVARGDTISDIVVRVIRDRSTQLVLDSPV